MREREKDPIPQQLNYFNRASKNKNLLCWLTDDDLRRQLTNRGVILFIVFFSTEQFQFFNRNGILFKSSFQQKSDFVQIEIFRRASFSVENLVK